jgi:peptidoglycan/LPS O-acetylase OafA/YrhL
MTVQSFPEITYRREIDGLRSVAVIPVVLYHGGFPYFHGGFIGVDIFFVISGYLITSVIVANLDKERFTLVEFYERRIRRILPALYAILLFSLIGSAATMDPSAIDELGRSLLSVLAFVSNIYFWQASGYFGSDAKLTPLLHTWSLAVEEQFYLLYPFFLSIVWFLGRFRVVLLLGAITLLSLAVAEWGSRNHATPNFFLAPSRSWELLTGAMVALAPRERFLRRVGPLLSQAASLVCLLTLIASFFAFNSTTPHPSLITVLPVVSTAGIILFCNGGLAGMILSNRYTVGIGLLSYSFYLWHQPIFVFARVYSPTDPGLIGFGLLSIVSLGIAYLSWKYIEQPFRNRKKIERRKIFAIAGVSSFAVLLLSCSLVVYNTIPLRFLDPESYSRYKVIAAANPELVPMAIDGCHFGSEDFTAEFRSSFDRCAARYGKAALITGDSHGIDLYNAIALRSSYPFIVSVSRGWCRAHTPINFRPPWPCHYAEVEAFAIAHAAYIGVLFYTQTPDRLFNKMWEEAMPDDLSVAAIDEVVTYLSEVRARSGVEVVIIGMLPRLNRSPYKFDFRQPLRDQVRDAYSPHTVKLTRYTDSIFRDRAAKHGIPYLSKMEAFELRLPEDVLVDGRFTYSDSGHLTVQGELYFGLKLVRHLVDWGYLRSGM